VKRALTRIVSWGHELISDIIGPGDLAIDLTAGNGYDTLFLARQVGETGQVVAFDVQSAALETSRSRLQEAGFFPRLHRCAEPPLPRQSGVDLIAAGHEHLEAYLSDSPRAIIANLGYLPGGDTRLITRTESTLLALEQASRLLAAGGRLVVVVYVGHPGGADEGDAVSGFFAGLDENRFQTLQMTVINLAQAPYLLVAEKKYSNI